MKSNRTPSRRAVLQSTAASLAAAVSLSGAAAAQEPGQAPAPAEPPKARAEDVASIESLVAALYEVISGPKGQARDWDRFRSLFAPFARLIPCNGKDRAGKPVARAFTAAQFAEIAAKSSALRGFFESEISRKTQRFGHIAHVFSTYESREAPGAAPFQRG
ncbi:MAG: hypothetical protein U0835_24675, partial [Isosphaeraceae bacterium]